MRHMIALHGGGSRAGPPALAGCRGSAPATQSHGEPVASWAAREAREPARKRWRAQASGGLRHATECGGTSREGCTLCDAARAFLAGKKTEYDFDVWEIDVDADPSAAGYSDLVPVATVGKKELFRLAPDFVRLDARLRALADRRVRR